MDALRRRLLPELMRRAVARGRALHIWSAGCSTGEEPYTLAMLALEVSAALPEAPEIRIVATDLSPGRRQRDRARPVRRSHPRARRARAARRWFVTPGEGGAHGVAPEVRSLVDVQLHNLVTDQPPFEHGEVDLVVCRNVTIYFARDTTRDLVGRFHGVLGAGGYLVLGHAETLWQVTDAFTLVTLGDAFAYRKDVPAVRVPAPAPRPTPAAPRRPLRRAARRAPRPRPRDEPTTCPTPTSPPTCSASPARRWSRRGTPKPPPRGRGSDGEPVRGRCAPRRGPRPRDGRRRRRVARRPAQGRLPAARARPRPVRARRRAVALRRARCRRARVPRRRRLPADHTGERPPRPARRLRRRPARDAVPPPRRRVRPAGRRGGVSASLLTAATTPAPSPRADQLPARRTRTAHAGGRRRRPRALRRRGHDLRRRRWRRPRDHARAAARLAARAGRSVYGLGSRWSTSADARCRWWTCAPTGRGRATSCCLSRRHAGLVVDRVVRVTAAGELVPETDEVPETLPSWTRGVVRPAGGGEPVVVVAMPDAVRSRPAALGPASPRSGRRCWPPTPDPCRRPRITAVGQSSWSHGQGARAWQVRTCHRTVGPWWATSCPAAAPSPSPGPCRPPSSGSPSSRPSSSRCCWCRRSRCRPTRPTRSACSGTPGVLALPRPRPARRHVMITAGGGSARGGGRRCRARRPGAEAPGGGCARPLLLGVVVLAALAVRHDTGGALIGRAGGHGAGTSLAAADRRGVGAGARAARRRLRPGARPRRFPVTTEPSADQT